MMFDASSVNVDRSPRFTVSLNFEDMQDSEQLCSVERRSKANLAKVLIQEALNQARSKGLISSNILNGGRSMVK